MGRLLPLNSATLVLSKAHRSNAAHRTVAEGGNVGLVDKHSVYIIPEEAAIAEVDLVHLVEIQSDLAIECIVSDVQGTSPREFESIETL